MINKHLGFMILLLTNSFFERGSILNFQTLFFFSFFTKKLINLFPTKGTVWSEAISPGHRPKGLLLIKFVNLLNIFCREFAC